jgi:ribosome biogenesis GTPase
LKDCFSDVYDMDVSAYGWNKTLHTEFKKNHDPNIFELARIISSSRGIYKAACSGGLFNAKISGAFSYMCVSQSDFPVTGDWAVINKDSLSGGCCIIHSLMKRKNELCRNRPGPNTEKQVLAVNLDYACIICGLDNDFNIHRIERYLTIIMACEIEPVIILSKADLVHDAEVYKNRTVQCDPQAQIFVVSSLTKSGIKEISAFLKKGKTICFLGSSGAGKSTLINTLSGNRKIRTSSVRDNDSRGRHTTTSREMYILPGGALVIDTPGLREIQLYDAGIGIDSVFSEIQSVSAGCRFKDCTHTAEPGCAVITAVRKGEISRKRYDHYLKLIKEEQRRYRDIHEQRLVEKRFQKKVNEFIRNKKKYQTP